MTTPLIQLHDRYLRGDPQAVQHVQQLRSRAGQGDAQASVLLQALAFHHDRTRQLSLRGPGQARVGGYGMPGVHRAGITIGATPQPQYQAANLTLDGARHILGLIAAASRPPPYALPMANRVAGLAPYQRHQAFRRSAPAELPPSIAGHGGPAVGGCGGYPYPSPALASWYPSPGYGLGSQGYPFAVAYQSPLACYRGIPGGLQYM